LAVRIRDIEVGRESGRPLLIAGPCVAESLDLCRQVAAEVKAICAELGFAYVFKASFDKANRTSGAAFRGSGMDAGLEILATIRSEFGVPVLTDIHESWQAKPAAEVVDVLQIPAFLCRQTDLLVAAAETGKTVNVKKGQFLAPWDMANVVKKVVESGNENLILTERGASFGYNTLVVDMTSLPQMRALGYPVCFDATHSTQKPGGAGTSTGGSRDMIPYLARAAAATGIDALFMEVHPEPEKGLSDAATMFRLSELAPLLRQLKLIDAIVRGAPQPK
jgi:2-dehydro-3-deoxyphosphooctonate aldolase (KDO 8-P synthase)